MTGVFNLRKGMKQIKRPKRSLVRFPVNTHSKTFEKMPFVERLIILSTKCLDGDLMINKTAKVIISYEDMLKYDLLIGRGPKYDFSFANGTLYISCLYLHAKMLGVTFAKLTRYRLKGGGVEKCLLKIDVPKFKTHKRFPFVMDKLFGQGPVECQVAINEDFIPLEHAFINYRPPKLNEEDPMGWVGRVGVNTQNVTDGAPPVYVYKVTDSLITINSLKQLIENPNIIAISGFSHKDAVIQYIHHQYPSDPADTPCGFVITRQGNDLHTTSFH